MSFKFSTNFLLPYVRKPAKYWGRGSIGLDATPTVLIHIGHPVGEDLSDTENSHSHESSNIASSTGLSLSNGFNSGQACDNKVIYVEIGSTVTIQSPGYPKTYPSKLNCTWTVSTVRNDERVRFEFLSLNIDARGDFLSLYDGKAAESKLKMTGPLDMIYLDDGKFLQPAEIKRPYFSSGKYMTLEMLSNDDEHQSSGFQLTATSLKKG